MSHNQEKVHKKGSHQLRNRLNSQYARIMEMHQHTINLKDCFTHPSFQKGNQSGKIDQNMNGKGFK